MTVKNTYVLTCIVGIVNVVKASNMEGYVVGGEISKIEDFPHSVYVTITCNKRSTSCGASIINQALLLTAAHCVNKCNDSFNITAYTGSEKKNQGLKNKVDRIKVHEKYNTTTHANDIALLKLEDDLTLGAKVQRVVLMKNPPEYKTALIAGWGWIDSVGTRGKNLKHVRQEIFDHNVCEKKIDNIPDGTICGREQSGASYPEKGDSGSALIADGSVQIGLVSFKKRSYANETIVYTNVTYFYDWVMENAVLLSCGSNETILRETPL